MKRSNGESVTRTVTDFSDDAWREFCCRHAGHRLLKQSALYSLTQEIIDAIGKSVLLRGFFSEDDLAFERDLAMTASMGFFDGHAIDWPEPKWNGIFAGRGGDVSEAEKELDKLESRNPPPRRARAEDVRRTEGQEDLHAGYRGWLICNSAYRAEVTGLRKLWGAEISKAGRFPRVSNSLWPLETACRDFPPLLVYHFFDFYLGWGLDDLSTWEWPNPMTAETAFCCRSQLFEFKIADLYPGFETLQLGSPSSTPVDHVVLMLGQSGPQILMPWPMLADGSLEIDAFIRRLRAEACPTHLETWLDKRLPDGSRKYFSGRFSNLATLYRYLYLALLARYADKCKGKLRKLTEAVAGPLNMCAETFRQTRMIAQSYLGRTSGAIMRESQVPQRLRGLSPFDSADTITLSEQVVTLTRLLKKKARSGGSDRRRSKKA